MPKPQKIPRSEIYSYAEVWPLIAYSTELHELMEMFADPDNWPMKEGHPQELAAAVLQRASGRPSGPSTPVWWVTWACTNRHTWSEWMRWEQGRGWKPVRTDTRNQANTPVCPECGQLNSAKTRQAMGIRG